MDTTNPQLVARVVLPTEPAQQTRVQAYFPGAVPSSTGPMVSQGTSAETTAAKPTQQGQTVQGESGRASNPDRPLSDLRSRAAQSAQSVYEEAAGTAQRARDAGAQVTQQARETGAQYAQSVAERAAQAKQVTQETAAQAAQRAREAAGEVAERARETSQEVAGRAREVGGRAVEGTRQVAAIASREAAEGARRVQETATAAGERAERELNRYPVLRNFEERTGIPKRYAAAALAVMMSLTFYFNFGARLLTNLVGISPAIYALNAPLQRDREMRDREAKKWITYLVTLAGFAVLEDRMWEGFILRQLPFWYFIKMAVLGWLAMPQFEGALQLYHRVVQPYLTGEAWRPPHTTGTASTSASRSDRGEDEFRREYARGNAGMGTGMEDRAMSQVPMGVPDHPVVDVDRQRAKMRQNAKAFDREE